MADGRIVVKAEVDAKNAQKELDKLTAKIDCNASCYAKNDHLLPHNDQV